MSLVVVAPANLFLPGWCAIVVPVNCVGVMGKGVAKEAAVRFPLAERFYKAKCRGSGVRPGEVWSPLRPGPGGLTPIEPFELWFAATKDHWRDPSRPEWVIECCRGIARQSFEAAAWFDERRALYPGRRAFPEQVAVPALGCGLGALSWAELRAPMAAELEAGHEATTFYLCPPRENR